MRNLWQRKESKDSTSLTEMGIELLLKNHWGLRKEVAVAYGVVVGKSSLGSSQFYKSLSIPED